MRNLFCIGGQNIEVTEQEEAKLTALIRADKLPPTITIRGTRIVSDTILGFSDKPVASEPQGSKMFTSAEDFFAWGRQQPWYRKRSQESTQAA